MFTKTLSLIAMAVLATPAHALEFDFTNVNGGAEGLLASTVSDNGVVATGYYSDPNSDVHGLTETNLWLRNVPNDHGLGVCSEGAEACRAGGGDVNELDNEELFEAIILDNTNGGTWTQLWVSSLDAGGDPDETGTLMWADALDGFTHESAFSFKFGDFGASVEGDILGLAAAAAFDAGARYLLFFAGDFGQESNNNDYLVWKGAIQIPRVPSPGVIALMGLGLLGIGMARRRSIRTN